MKKVMLGSLVFLLGSFNSVSHAQQACDWTGTWTSTYGDLKLIQTGDNVSGDYSTVGTLEGTVREKCALYGTFDNTLSKTKGHFKFRRNKEMFAGKWGFDGQGRIKTWRGNRISLLKPALQKSKAPQSEVGLFQQELGQSSPPLSVYSPAKSSPVLPSVVDLIVGAKKTPSTRTVFGCEVNQLITVDEKGVWHKGRLARGAMEIYDSANAAHTKGDAIRALALTPDCHGGVVVSDNNFTVKHYSSARVTDTGKPLRLEIWGKINELRMQNKTITAIAFDPYEWENEDRNKSYVIVYDGGFYASKNIDLRFKSLLRKALRKGPVYSVGFYPRPYQKSAWVILGANGLVYTSNSGKGGLPKYSHEKMLNRLLDAKMKLNYLSFAPYISDNSPWAYGNAKCETSNTVTQRIGKSCSVGLIDVDYKRKDQWSYACPSGAASSCRPYQTPVGLFHTSFTPKHWIAGRDIIEVQVCDKDLVNIKKGVIAVYSPSKKLIKTVQLQGQCSVEFDAKEGEGTYRVNISLTGLDENGVLRSNAKIVPIIVRDIWIAILGDSYASGEGASFYDVKDPAIHEAKWLYDGVTSLRPSGMHCNASPVAWGAKAAEFLSGKTPHYGVKISNFACSGSTLTSEGFIRKIETVNNVETPYIQAAALKRAIKENGGRKPDFVLFTAGGNDVHFANIIAECLTLGCAKDSNPKVITNVYGDSNAPLDSEGRNDKAIFTKAAAGLGELAQRYAKFDGYLTQMGIDPSTVVMPSYFDATQGSNGKAQVCQGKDFQLRSSVDVKSVKRIWNSLSRAANSAYEGDLDGAGRAYTSATQVLIQNKNCPFTKMPKLGLEVLAPFTMTEASYQRAIDEVAKPLKIKQREAAKTHGWVFSERADSVYNYHGNCSAEPYTNRICEAIRRTGDFNGAFHPNKEGHAAAGLVVGQDMLTYYSRQADTIKYFE